MAIFGTFHHKLGNVWPREYIADNGEVFYLRRRACEQLVFIAADILYCAEGEKNNAVIEYPAVAQMDADCNEHCTIERAGRLLRLNAKECRLGSCELEWHERRKIIDNIKG
jgi:hypothetical protein